MIAILVYFHELVGYGISQGWGQGKIIWGAEPIEKVLEDTVYSDTIKNKIRLVQEIRKFAFDSLGINQSENYTTFYDQKGQPLLWVVTAAEPFKLKAKEWSFPILGSFSYKGFFKYEKAKNEEEELKKEGFDTAIDEVSGWSTLGWFKDPILSKMLKRSPGNLANLIIHELTHGTLYVKDNVEFNENLASFAGDKGALKFLIYKYGKDSKEYKDYIFGRKFNQDYTAFVLKQASRMDSLYNTFGDKISIRQKKQKKEMFLKEISFQLGQFLVTFNPKNRGIADELNSLNNTYFLDYRRYHEDLGIFEEEFKTRFNSDIKSYMNYLKKKYPSL
ncbi:MAG: aminopeptidase [Cytophagaceae bacterium]|nr:aminopeptidase [Cytophagaceae bacterium]